VNPTLQPAPADPAAQADPAMPDGTHPPERKPLGALLVHAGLISEAQLEQALREGADTGERVGEVVVRHLWATEDDVARVLAEQWGLSYVDRASIFFDADALARLSREDAQRLEALPTRVQDGRVVVAVAEPTEQRLAALQQLIGDTVMVVVPRSALQAGLHSELLSSRSNPTVEEPPLPQEHPPAPEPPAEAQRPLEAVPPPASADAPAPAEAPAPADPPAPAEAPAPAAGLEGVAALAAQARGLADLMAAQAAELSEGLSATEELAVARQHIGELESQLAAQRVAVQELRRHLEAALGVLDRGL
jgi:hypothetical protein